VCIVVENDNNSNGNNADRELNRFRLILNNKINEKKNQIFPSHGRAYNKSVQYEINCLRWVIEKTSQRQIQMSQVKDITQIEPNDVNRKMNAKSVNIEKGDMFITYIETLIWVLYVIHGKKRITLEINYIASKICQNLLQYNLESLM